MDKFYYSLGGIASLVVCLQQGIKIKQTALENQWGLKMPSSWVQIAFNITWFPSRSGESSSEQEKWLPRSPLRLSLSASRFH